MFVVDSPMLMVILYNLIEKRATQMGGKITRYANYFFDSTGFGHGGTLNTALTEPPCIKLLLQIDGWTYEVMMMLPDFVNVKQVMHKFYELSRAPDLEAALDPIFPPLSDIRETSGVAGNPLNAVRQNKRNGG